MTRVRAEPVWDAARRWILTWKCALRFAPALHAEHRADGGTGKVAFRDEPARSAGRDERPVVRAVAAGGKDHRGRALELRELLGHLEAVDVGKLNVEQDQLGAALTHCVDAFDPSSGLINREAFRLKQRASAGAKTCAVVDDQSVLHHADHARRPSERQYGYHPCLTEAQIASPGRSDARPRSESSFSRASQARVATRSAARLPPTRPSTRATAPTAS